VKPTDGSGPGGAGFVGEAALFFFLIHLACPAFGAAIQVDELDPRRDWRLEDLTFTGNERISTGELREVLAGQPRPWYAFWRPLPPFNPAVFKTDLQRLERSYRAMGYYEAEIAHDLETREGDRVAARIHIREGDPVKAARVAFEITDRPELGAELEGLRRDLPLSEGQVFSEQRYRQTDERITEFFLNRGYARVKVERKAEVVLERHEASVYYRIEGGPPSVFGETTVEGLEDVEPHVVLRELAYETGERFSKKALEESRKNLVALDLFGKIDILPDPRGADPAVVPIVIELEEKPPREVLLGIGYGTEDQLRGQARWRHNNWLGGARRLEIGAKVSFIAREAEARFVQPHFLGRHNRYTLGFGPKQFDEPGYFLTVSRLEQRFERKFTPTFLGFVEHRVEWNNLEDVPAATVRRLGDFERKGFLSGIGIGVFWNRVDDPLEPRKGWTLSLGAEEVGGPLGGSFDFYRLRGEGTWFYPLASRTVFATRLKLGFSDPFGDSREVPIFERFFAGGSKSVRGYGRHRLGPLSATDDPLGGRSMIEGSVELRQQITDTLGGALFLDFGQISLRSFDFPVDDLEAAAGFGFSYKTPVGPLRLDVGFPFDPPGDDRAWQVHFSIGHFF
jgi:outer membrane protein insertion porin family/translocation and assembly module TamA